MNTHSDAEVLALWQQQAREEHIQPFDEIRLKAERLDAKTRRWNVFNFGLFLLLLIMGAFEVWLQTETLDRAGDLLLMAALVYVAHRYRNQRLAAPVALGRMSCVEFYRAALVRERDLSQDSRGYLLPFVPGMTLALLGGLLEERPASQKVMLIALGVGLFVGVHAWNTYTARKLTREIDRLETS